MIRIFLAGGLFGILYFLTVVMLLTATLFFFPRTIVHQKNINWLLSQIRVLESWQWQEFEFEHQWVKWNKRKIGLSLKGFCFSLHHPASKVESCWEDFDWQVNLGWGPRKGFYVLDRSPLQLTSSLTQVTPLQQPEQSQKTSKNLPDYLKYWKLIWKRTIPELNLRFDKIELLLARPMEFDLEIQKTDQSLQMKALGFQLNADPQNFELKTPSLYELPVDNQFLGPIFLRNFVLAGKIVSNQVNFLLEGKVGTLDLELTTHLSTPTTQYSDTKDLIRQLILAGVGRIKIESVSKQIKRTGRKPYNQLPAPFNSMDGTIDISFHAHKTEVEQIIEMVMESKVDMKGAQQILQVDVTTRLPVNVQDWSHGEILVDVEFEKLLLHLPRLARARPPQFKPDSRIRRFDSLQDAEQIRQTLERPTQTSAFGLWLKTRQQKSFSLRSNLLSKDIRMNFDLQLRPGQSLDGFLSILPFKTTIFKRRVELNGMRILFSPLQETILDALVTVRLPEYKVHIKFEGPLTKPRYVLSSEPPLPHSDILAVLFFGRPLMELDPDNRHAAARANYILSQGLLSLTALYLLAGTPVEAIGYDPNSNEVSAQLGLGRRTSLRIGRAQGGLDSLGLRYSLGGGWYVDTTAREVQTLDQKQAARDYGMILERIIAY